jgi:hypothetical protein
MLSGVRLAPPVRDGAQPFLATYAERRWFKRDHLSFQKGAEGMERGQYRRVQPERLAKACRTASEHGAKFQERPVLFQKRERG